jgi:hypothetical protein
MHVVIVVGVARATVDECCLRQRRTLAGAYDRRLLIAAFLSGFFAQYRRQRLIHPGNGDPDEIHQRLLRHGACGPGQAFEVGRFDALGERHGDVHDSPRSRDGNVAEIGVGGKNLVLAPRTWDPTSRSTPGPRAANRDPDPDSAGAIS